MKIYLTSLPVGLTTTFDPKYLHISDLLLSHSGFLVKRYIFNAEAKLLYSQFVSTVLKNYDYMKKILCLKSSVRFRHPDPAL